MTCALRLSSPAPGPTCRVRIAAPRCRRTPPGWPGSLPVMCPSFMVRREEKHSTRGRARLLQEMAEASGPVRDRWRSEEVKEALDLCLACEGCKGDCPVKVDMATYKAEFLHHYYRGARGRGPGRRTRSASSRPGPGWRAGRRGWPTSGRTRRCSAGP
ncbi:MAG TPA: (Fe-S)-binding protein [Trebonia sp.]|nr:(Fe-S)-binding protein [Trebonia sp.]